jgi:mannosyltransferase
MKIKNKNHFILLAIIVIALLMRLVKLDQSLWLDEAIGANLVNQSGISYIWNVFSTVDNHPPLYYVMLNLWSDIFGYSEIALRSMSVIFGVGTVYLTYKIAYFLAGKKNRYVAGIAALLIATSQFHIYYSQEARMYIVAGFFATLAIYSFLLTLKKDSFVNWLIYSVALTCMMFSDYMPVFLLPVFWIYALIAQKSDRWYTHFVSSYTFLGLSGLIWLPMLIQQVRNGIGFTQILPAWEQLAGGADLRHAALLWVKFTLGRIDIPNYTVYIITVVLVSAPFIIALYYALKRRELKLLWLWLVFPVVSAYVISYFFPAFNYFRFVYIIPALYILVAFGTVYIKNKTVKLLIVSMIIVANLASYLHYLTDEHQQRENWKAAVSFVESNVKDNDIVLFTNPEPFAPYQYYTQNKVQAFGATDSISANFKGTTEKTSKLIEDKKGIFLFEYLSYLHDPNGYVSSTIKKEGFTNQDTYDFSGVGFISYWKR